MSRLSDRAESVCRCRAVTFWILTLKSFDNMGTECQSVSALKRSLSDADVEKCILLCLSVVVDK